MTHACICQNEHVSFTFRRIVSSLCGTWHAIHFQMNGVFDVWDFLYKQNEPTLSVPVGETGGYASLYLISEWSESNMLNDVSKGIGRTQWRGLYRGWIGVVLLSFFWSRFRLFSSVWYPFTMILCFILQYVLGSLRCVLSGFRSSPSPSLQSYYNIVSISQWLSALVSAS